MNYRLATLLGKKSYTADFTEPIDIKLVDPISQIVLLYKSQAGDYSPGTSTYAMPIAAITKVEIVDGSDVLFSLSGAEAQGIDFYHNKRETLGETRFMGDGWSQCVVNINFGRFLYDPVLAFDPRKFVNPQLKVTVDISAGACDSDNARLTVMAHVFHDKQISPVGFLMQKEIKSYSIAADHEYTDLPLDYPIRKLFMKALYPEYMPSALLTRIKLSEDQDRAVVIDELLDEILAALMQQTPPYSEHILTGGCTTTGYGWCTPAQRSRVLGTPWSVPHSSDQEVCAYGAPGGRFQFDQGLVSNIVFHAEGWCPHGILEVPFGDQMEIDDWYDVTKLGSLKLDITGTAARGTCQIMLQQERTY